MANLGNVSGVIRSVNPPLEQDGITVKKYVLWARPIGAVDINGHALGGLYDTFYWSYTIGDWTNLDNQLTAANTLPYGQYFIFKKQGNTGTTIQIGDIIQGWFSDTKFIKAIYVTGPLNDLGSFTVLEELDI